jgi:hypothetical protein
MNTPFKMKPGRGNMPKTGNGLPTPLRQDHGGDIELTKKYTEGVEKYKENREKGNTPSGMKVDAVSGFSTPNLPMHTVVKSGTKVRELDSKGNVVREEQQDSRGNMSFYANVDKRNREVTSRQTRNANLYNAFGGGTSPDKLSEEQKRSLIATSKATPVKQKMKMAPAKMKKC